MRQSHFSRLLLFGEPLFVWCHTLHRFIIDKRCTYQFWLAHKHLQLIGGRSIIQWFTFFFTTARKQFSNYIYLVFLVILVPLCAFLSLILKSNFNCVIYIVNLYQARDIFIVNFVKITLIKHLTKHRAVSVMLCDWCHSLGTCANRGLFLSAVSLIHRPFAYSCTQIHFANANFPLAMSNGVAVTH